MRSAQTDGQTVHYADAAKHAEIRTYQRVLAIVCAGSVCALLCAISRAPLRSLSEYGDFGKLYAAALVITGLLVAVGVYVCLIIAARRRTSIVIAVGICVHGCGWLGVRDKTHVVTLEEVRGVIIEETDVLIIGTGYE